ncbi:MAG: hypothetical protein A3K18_01655, partial [Lentisphaerae bacterium RIFOXYA12_64_32]
QIDVQVNGAKNLGGQSMPAPFNAPNLFNVFMAPPPGPGVVSATPAPNPVLDANVGVDMFTLTVLFDEAMDNVYPPFITFPGGGEDPTLDGTLAFTGGAWSTTTFANDTYTASYTVTDFDLAMPQIDVQVNGAKNLGGQSMPASFNAPNLFNVAMDGSAVPPPVIDWPPDGSTRSNPVLTVSGTARPGDKVQVSLNGSPSGSPINLGAGTRWQVTLLTPLTRGSNLIAATAIDGNEIESDSVEFWVTLDDTFIAFEDWESSLDGAHGWRYWAEQTRGLPEDLPLMHFLGTGAGENHSSGYARADLGGARASVLPELYWVCYRVTDPSKAIYDSEPVNGDFADASISVAVNDLNSANLQGGSIHFFVGKWDPTANAGVGAGKYFVFNTPVLDTAGGYVDNGQWQLRFLQLDGEVENWTEYGALTGAGNQLADLLVRPPQWGFMLKTLASRAQPTGFLGFDSLCVTKGPTVTIDQAPGQADPTGTSPITFRAVFSEDVADFAADDVPVYGSTGATSATVTTVVSDTVYDLAVTGMGIDGDVLVNIMPGAAHDENGFGNQRARLIDNRVTYTTAAGPEIAVEGNTRPIFNGDNSPSSANGTDFGGAAIGGGTVTQTFTIRDLGTEGLILTETLTPVQLSGSTAFSVTAPPEAFVNAGSSTTFTITYAPTASGLDQATVSIPNNDTDENPFTFAIQGQGGEAPQFTQQPENFSATEGTDATFSAAASGDPAPGLRWQKSVDSGTTWVDLAEDSTYTGTASGTLTVHATTLAMDGDQFRCVANNGLGGDSDHRVASDAATLTVTTGTDTDTDGLPDAWEQQIVDDDPSDAILAITDVLPTDDYDGDNETNATEYANGTDPTDASSAFTVENRYGRFGFELFRLADQQAGGGLTNAGFGVHIELVPLAGETYGTGDVAKPGTAGAVSLLGGGNAPVTYDSSYAGFGDLSTDWPGGTYRLKVPVTVARTSFTRRVRVQVPVSYVETDFPGYVTVQTPQPGDTTTATPTFDMGPANYNWRSIWVLDSVQTQVFEFRQPQTPVSSVTVPQNTPLPDGNSTLYVNRTDSSHLGSQTRVSFTVAGTQTPSTGITRAEHACSPMVPLPDSVLTITGVVEWTTFDENGLSLVYSLPDGWDYVPDSGDTSGNGTPSFVFDGATDSLTLSFTARTLPNSPLNFSFQVQVPLTITADGIWGEVRSPQLFMPMPFNPERIAGNHQPVIDLGANRGKAPEFQIGAMAMPLDGELVLSGTPPTGSHSEIRLLNNVLFWDRNGNHLVNSATDEPIWHDTDSNGVYNAGTDVAINDPTAQLVDGAVGRPLPGTFLYYDTGPAGFDAGDPVWLNANNDPSDWQFNPASAAAIDADSPANFDGGVLFVDLLRNGADTDAIFIRNQGTGAGQIGVIGGTVTYGSLPIGAFEGGANQAPLKVTLNADATTAAVSALTRSLMFQSHNLITPVDQRTVRFALTDGDSPHSARSHLFSVNVWQGFETSADEAKTSFIFELDAITDTAVREIELFKFGVSEPLAVLTQSQTGEEVRYEYDVQRGVAEWEFERAFPDGTALDAFGGDGTYTVVLHLFDSDIPIQTDVHFTADGSAGGTAVAAIETAPAFTTPSDPFTIVGDTLDCSWTGDVSNIDADTTVLMLETNSPHDQGREDYLPPTDTTFTVNGLSEDGVWALTFNAASAGPTFRNADGVACQVGRFARRAYTGTRGDIGTISGQVEFDAGAGTGPLLVSVMQDNGQGGWTFFNSYRFADHLIRGNPTFAPFLLRLPLGTYAISAHIDLQVNGVGNELLDAGESEGFYDPAQQNIWPGTPIVLTQAVPDATGVDFVLHPARFGAALTQNRVAAKGVFVVDSLPPFIPEITTTAESGIYAADQTIPITLLFSEPVTLKNDDGGALVIELNNGVSFEIETLDKQQELSVDYVIGGADAPVQTLNVSRVYLSETAQLVDGYGNDTETGPGRALLLPPGANLADHADITISAGPDPIITIDTLFGDDNVINGAEAASLIVNGTTANVEAGRTVTVTLSDGHRATVVLTGAVQPDGTWAAGPAPVTSLADGPITLSASVTNLDNEMATDTATAVKDTARPVVTAVTVSAPSLLGKPVLNTQVMQSGLFSLAFVFNKSMAQDSDPNLTFPVEDPGTALPLPPSGAWSAGRGSTWTAWFDIANAADLEMANIDVAIAGATDLVGNPMAPYTAANLFHIDTLAPSVTINGPADGASVNAGAVIAFTVIGGVNPQVSVNGIDWTPAVSGTTTLGAIPEFGFVADSSPFTLFVGASDPAGNKAEATLSLTKETSGPGVLITSAEPDPTKALSFTVDIDFSKAVFGFNAPDITVANGSVLNLSGVGAHYTAIIKPTADGTVTVQVPSNQATDLAGNGNLASNPFHIVSDRTNPVVSILKPDLNVSVNGDAVLEFTVTDASPPFTVEASANAVDWSVVTSPVPLFEVAGFATILQGNFTLRVRAADAAGNNGFATRSLTKDTVPPTVAILSPAEDAKVNDQTVVVATATGASVVKASVDGGAHWTTLTGNAFTLGNIPEFASLSEGGFTLTLWAQDAAGNEDTKHRSFERDAGGPTVVITSTSPSPTNAASIPVTVTFSEDVTGFGATDLILTNASFRIGSLSGNAAVYTLEIQPVADGTVSIRVKAGGATDEAGNGNMLSSLFSLESDRTAPAITITAPPRNASVTGSSTFTFTTNDNSAPVEVFEGGRGWIPAVSGATLGGLLIFQNTADGGAFDLKLRSMDAAGNLGEASVALIKDVTAPVLTITTPLSSPTNATAIPVTLRFSEPVLGFDSTDLTVSNATASGFTAVGATYAVNLAPLADGTVTLTVATAAARDAAGNPNPGPVTFQIVSQRTAPSIAITSPANNAAANGNAVIRFSVPVNVVDTKVAINGGAQVPAVSGTTRIADVPGFLSRPVAEGASFTLTLYATDGASNTSTSTINLTKDTTRPEVTVTTTVPNPTNRDTLPVTVTFTEPVVGFDASDLTLTNGTVAAFFGSGSIYTATIRPVADGTVLVSVTTDKAADAAGNGNTAAIPLAMTSDRTPPLVAITQPPDGAAVNGAKLLVFGIGDGANPDASIDGNIWQAATSNTTTMANLIGFNALPEGTVFTLQVRAMDAAGNTGKAGVNLRKATIGPLVVISSTLTGPTSAAEVPLVITFSESVTDFEGSDVVLGNASLKPGSFAGSGRAYAATLLPAGEGVVTADVPAGRAESASDTHNQASNHFEITIDRTGPTLTVLTPAASASANHSTVLTFTNGDNTSVQASVGGNVWTFVTSGSRLGDVNGFGLLGQGGFNLQLRAKDKAGNDGSTQLALIKDTLAPTGTISSALNSPTNAVLIPLTVSFTESVTDFVLGDMTAVGGTLSNFAANRNAYTVDLTPTLTDGTITVGIPAANVHDAAGNALKGDVSFSIVHDTTAPTVTINQAALQPDPVNSSPIRFTAVFSEAVSGFTAGDIQISGTAGATTATIAATATAVNAYQVEVSGMTQAGTVIVTIPAAAASDLAGNASVAATFTDNSVTYDTTLPAITSITSTTANGTYTAGAAINVRVNFSKPVTLAGGNLRVTLDTGAVVTLAPFTNASFANGTYTVAVGENSPDLDARDISLATTATLRDQVSNNVPVGLPGTTIATGSAIVVDTTAPVPTLTSTVQGASNVTSIPVTVVFTEPVAGFTASDLAVTNATVGGFTGTGASYSFNLSPTADGTITVGLPAAAATDAAGNGNTAATSLSIVSDRTAPGVTVRQATSQADPVNTEPIRFTANFTEPVLGFEPADVTVNVGGLRVTPKVAILRSYLSATTYTLEVSDLPPGTVTVTIPANGVTDVAGNANSASTVPAGADNQVTYDPAPPAVTSITSATPNGAYGAASRIDVTVNFSKPVSLVGGYLLVGLDTGGTAVIAPFAKATSGSGNYIVAGGHNSSDLDAATVTLQPGATLVDNAGNAVPLTRPGSTIAGTSNIVIDTRLPTVTGMTTSAPDPSNLALIPVIVTFSESVTGLTTSSFLATNATVSALTGSGSNYTVSLAPSSDGRVTFSVPANVAIDVAGNRNLGATSPFAITSDRTRPTVTINQGVGQPDPVNSSPIRFRAVFSKPVTGFEPADVTITGTAGATTATIIAESATTYLVAVSGMTQAGTVQVTVRNSAATDAAGNSSTASTSTDNQVTYDTTLPSIVSVTSTTPNGQYGTGAAINVTVTFSKAVTLSGGSLLVGLDTGATVAIAPFTNAAAATASYVVAEGQNSPDIDVISLSLGSGAALRDAAIAAVAVPVALPGTTIADGSDIGVDTTRPGVTISTAPDVLASVFPIPVTIRFTEPVFGFTADNVTVRGGNVVNFLGANDTYTVNVDPDLTTDLNGDGTVEITVTVTANQAADAAGNPNTASNTFAVAADQTPPTIAAFSTATPDGSYSVGCRIDITVQFSEPVWLTEGAELVLTLNSGTVELRTITIDTLDGGVSATAVYTVQEGDAAQALDVSAVGVSAGGIRAGGALIDEAGNEADLSVLPAGPASLAGDVALKIVDISGQEKRYLCEVLEPLALYDHCKVLGLNADGVAGGFSYTSGTSATLKACYWPADSGFATEIPEIAPFASLATAISDGMIAGYGPPTSGTPAQAFAYAAGDAVPVFLNALAGAPSTKPFEAYGICRQTGGALRVVGYGYDATGQRRACAWDAASGLTFADPVSLGSLNETGKSSMGYAVNDTGVMVGDAVTAGNVWHAFRYADGVMQDIDNLQSTLSAARAVNGSGVVAGFRSDAFGRQRAFLWRSAAEGMLDQPDLGVANAAANAVNVKELAAGWAAAEDGTQHAVVWKNNAVRRLDMLSDVTDFELRTASAVTDTDLLAGTGAGLAGLQRGFRLRPSEPQLFPLVELLSPAAGAEVPVNIALTVQLDTFDLDGRVVSVRLFVNNTVIAADDSKPFELQWTPDATGPTELLVEARDGDGNCAVSAVVTVTVIEQSFQFNLVLESGWNLISVPITPVNPSVAGVLGGVNFGTVWRLGTGGQASKASTIEPGYAYWAYLLGAEGETVQVAVTGYAATRTAVSVVSGWNCLGPIATPPDGQTFPDNMTVVPRWLAESTGKWLPPAYQWEAGGYQLVTDALLLGRGYFIYGARSDSLSLEQGGE